MQHICSGQNEDLCNEATVPMVHGVWESVKSGEGRYGERRLRPDGDDHGVIGVGAQISNGYSR
jgi:hypothetical protein